MSLISVLSLSCEHASRCLFKDANFSIASGDKVAVVGPNGCGKSSLLDILANPDGSQLASVVKQNGLRVAFCPQKIQFDPDHSIYDHLFQSDSSVTQAYKAYDRALKSYQTFQTTESEQAFNDASQRMDQCDAWVYESRVRALLNELHIDDLNKKMGLLSGGMLKKIALAQFFLEPADCLILDEPTNHLDIPTIEWLEKRLLETSSALIMVTHDRYFLNKVCQKIIEIDQQTVYTYDGNYEAYLAQREQRLARAQKSESRVQSVLRVELAWLKRGPKARSTKQKARKDRIHALMTRDALTPEAVLSFNVADRRMGKKICELKAISKSFDERCVIRPFSYRFNEGDRIGILGPNGSGKTTLVNMIMQELRPDSGEIDVGVNTEFGYFDQHSASFDPYQTVLEFVNEIGSHIKQHDGTYVSGSKLLEQFLFSSEQFNTPIGQLSGGEKRRLHLVSLLLKNPNFLIFDEPTNDLDIQTLSVLEQFLCDFKGSVIVISHDRYFLDRVVNQLFVLKPNTDIAVLAGSYSDYADVVKDIHLLDSERVKNNDKPSISNNQKNRQKQKQIQMLEKKIENLESKKKQILMQQLSDMGFDHPDYKQQCEKSACLDTELDTAMSEWSALVDND